MMKFFYNLLRFSLGIIFLYSGISKMIEPEVFAVLIESYGILPEILVFPTSVLLIIMEIIAGAGLLFEIKWSLELLTGLLLLFIGVLTYGIILGLDIDCGCFGKEEPEYKAYHGLRTALYRDIIMIAGIIYLYIWRYYKSPELVSINSLITNLRKGKK